MTPVEDRVFALEQHWSVLVAGISTLQADVNNIHTGAQQINGTLTVLAEHFQTSQVQQAAANALLTASMAGLNEQVVQIRTAQAARAWPASARATVIAAVIACVGALVTAPTSLFG